MFSIFGKKSKSPGEVVKALKELLIQCPEKSSGVDSSIWEKHSEEITKNIAAIKFMMVGVEGQDPSPEVVTSLANAIYSNNLLTLLIKNFKYFEFEAKKDTSATFVALLRRRIATRWTTVEHICNNSEILELLLAGYEESEVAINSGLMLRECIRHESLTKLLLGSPSFYKLFDYVELTNFDVSSDAFASFKDLLTKHKTITANFLNDNYDKVFEKYTVLLHSENYVTKRQSLKLLSELLLDRANFKVMTRYISDTNNLKLMMNLLKDGSKSIQFEAFHVFKVFVANPNKTQAVMDILLKNKDKLLAYLKNFHTDKDKSDDQFSDEKQLLINEISNLEKH